MNKSLIIYFSRADENYAVGYVTKGNTEIVAEILKDLTNADIFKVERKIPYAKDYKTCIEQAKREQARGEKPELKNYLTSIDNYDIIYIGGPIYWGTLPQPMFTELEKLDFNGKTVKPFTTHEGSGLGSVVKDLKNICKGADVKQGIAIVGSKAKSAKPSLEKWIKE